MIRRRRTSQAYLDVSHNLIGDLESVQDLPNLQAGWLGGMASGMGAFIPAETSLGQGRGGHTAFFYESSHRYVRVRGRGLTEV